MSQGTIRISSELVIAESELSYRASRSGGPGGQHANTSSTRVELVWDLAGSPSLSEDQRERLATKLRNRINADGELLIASSVTRSQHRNRQDAQRRFVAILQSALKRPKRRKRTRPPRSANEKRLKEKKQRSQIKRSRRRPRRDE